MPTITEEQQVDALPGQEEVLENVGLGPVHQNTQVGQETTHRPHLQSAHPEESVQEFQANPVTQIDPAGEAEEHRGEKGGIAEEEAAARLGGPDPAEPAGEGEDGGEPVESAEEGLECLAALLAPEQDGEVLAAQGGQVLLEAAGDQTHEHSDRPDPVQLSAEGKEREGAEDS